MKKFVMIALVALTMIGCGRIETGFVGVRTDFNKKVDNIEMEPGFYTAFFTSVDEYVAKEIEVAFNGLTPKGRDNLVLADFDISIFYQPTANTIADLKIKYTGMSPRSDDGFYFPAYYLVERTARGAIFDAVSQYDSLTIHTKRGELEEKIKNIVQHELDITDKGSFAITRVIVRSIKTDPALEKSIQFAVEMEKKTEAKLLELKLAEAEAQRLIVEASGQAKANEILANSLTPAFIQYKQIEMQGRFAQQGTHTVLFGDSPGALVNVK